MKSMSDRRTFFGGIAASVAALFSHRAVAAAGGDEVVVSEALAKGWPRIDGDDYPRLWVKDGYLHMATSYEVRWMRHQGMWKRMYPYSTLEEMREMERQR